MSRIGSSDFREGLQPCVILAAVQHLLHKLYSFSQASTESTEELSYLQRMGGFLRKHLYLWEVSHGFLWKYHSSLLTAVEDFVGGCCVLGAQREEEGMWIPASGLLVVRGMWEQSICRGLSSRPALQREAVVCRSVVLALPGCGLCFGIRCWGECLWVSDAPACLVALLGFHYCLFYCRLKTPVHCYCVSWVKYSLLVWDQSISLVWNLVSSF